jgi:hypothetical protein
MATTSIGSAGITFPDTTVQATSAQMPSGTVMIFKQTAAPTGWTKDATNYNNSMLRVVTGTASTGGTVDFTTAFTSQAVSGTMGNTTLVTAEIASHTHTVPTGVEWAGNNADYRNAFGRYGAFNPTSAATGGAGAHNHSFTGTAINLAVNYVDIIRASKN